MYKVFEYSEGSNSLRWIWSWLVFFFFKQKTAYEMRISDWSSDVCSSDLFPRNSAGASAPDAPRTESRPTPRGAAPARPRRTAAEAEYYSAGGRAARSRATVRPSDPRSLARSGIRRRRSEERRVGKEGVSKCRSRWSP